MKNLKLLITIVLATFLLLSFASAYYKYFQKTDFDSLFYVDCSTTEENCFVSLYDCEEGVSVEECGYYYKVYVVNQGTINTLCEPDDGDCLTQVCEEQKLCKVVDCQSPETLTYKLLDECANN